MPGDNRLPAEIVPKTDSDRIPTPSEKFLVNPKFLKRVYYIIGDQPNRIKAFFNIIDNEDSSISSDDLQTKIGIEPTYFISSDNDFESRLNEIRRNTTDRFLKGEWIKFRSNVLISEFFNVNEFIELVSDRCPYFFEKSSFIDVEEETTFSEICQKFKFSIDDFKIDPPTFNRKYIKNITTRFQKKTDFPNISKFNDLYWS